MEFPCEFPLKIIGKNNANFTNNIIDIVRKHFPDTLDEAIASNISNKNNYLAISVNIYAQDQQTLDNLYYQLTQYPDIKMVL
jgi:putative lipoic acid-binding regulatory protein